MHGHETRRAMGHDAGRTSALDAYLMRFERALAPLAPVERADILMETRSHVAERLRRAPGDDIDDVLAELGTPEAYARRFLPEADAPASATAAAAAPRASLASDDARGTLAGLATLATGRLAAMPLLALVLLAYSVALLLTLVAIDKVFEPRATGLDVAWTRPGRHALLTVSNPQYHAQHDPLGWWLVPLLLGVAIGIHLLMRALLRRFARSMGDAARVALVLVLVAGASRTASAQGTGGRVEGVVTTTEDSTPIAFALVRLVPVVPGRDTTRRQVVATAQGRYRLTDVPAGEYQLHVLRIGHRPVIIDAVQLHAGEVVRRDVRAPTDVLQLAAVKVRTAPACLPASRLVEEPRLAELWNQVRSGVELRRTFERQYRYTRAARQDISVRRAIGTHRSVRRDSAVNEPDSVDARDARRAAQNRERGYAKGGQLTLPNEKEIFSDDFLEDHCLEAAVEDSAGLYGLRFRPIARRKSGADVRGIVWVEGDSYQVRHLGVTYVRGDDAFAWAEIDYADIAVNGGALRLPTGGTARLDPGLAGLMVLVRDASAVVRYDYRGFVAVR